MKFTPRTEREIQEMKLSPEGDYYFEVKRAEDAKSKKDYEYIKLTLAIWQENNQSVRVIFDNLFSDEKIKHFCDSVGLETVYKSGELMAVNCENATGRLRLVVKEDSYGLKNEVRDYLPYDASTKAGHKDEELNDDIPF